MTISDINQLIHIDPGLSETQRQFLANDNVQKDIEKFLAGGAGAAVGVVLAKYLKLSKTVQIILGVLGYGAGSILYNFMRNQKPSGRYDAKTGIYEIDSKRF